MTTVKILIQTPGPAGPVPAIGVLRFTPTQRHTIAGTPAAVVMPASFATTLDAAGAATVELEQTTDLWVWKVETFITGVSGFTRYVSVPAAGPVDYAALTEVDPATLAPTAAPDPAWPAMARSTVTSGAIQGDDLVLTRTDGTTVDAGNVRGPQGTPNTLSVIGTTTGPPVPGTPGPANILTIGTVATNAAGSAATASVAGTSPNQTLNLGLPKGDPGGITLGTVLGTSDLNTVINPGAYRQSDVSGTPGSLASNYPVTGFYGTVVVWATSGDIWQEAHQQSYNAAVDSRKFYRRAKSNGAWSPWRAYNSTRVDQTAGRAIYQWDDLNSREQLIYGNTGARDISTLLNANWTLVNTPSNGFATVQRVNNTVTLDITKLTRTAAGITVLTLPTGFRPINDARSICGTVEATPTVHSFVVWQAGNMDFEASVPSGPGVNLVHSYYTNDPWPTTLPGTAIGAIPNV